MWRELIEKVCSECNFAEPTVEEAIQKAERELGVAFPVELRALLLESNGVVDRYGDGILSVSAIVSRNLEMRADFQDSDLCMPFDSLLFFGESGNGDLFCFPIQSNGKINNPDIFVWSHETDSRLWSNNNLEQFVKKFF